MTDPKSYEVFLKMCFIRYVHEHSLSRLGTGTKIRSGGVKVVYWTTVSFLSEMMLHLYKLISITRRPLEIRNIRVKTNQVICTNKREKNFLDGDLFILLVLCI
jgi:hypothetical protein